MTVLVLYSYCRPRSSNKTYVHREFCDIMALVIIVTIIAIHGRRDSYNRLKFVEMAMSKWSHIDCIIWVALCKYHIIISCGLDYEIVSSSMLFFIKLEYTYNVMTL